MKLLFRQSKSESEGAISVLSHFGIRQSYLNLVQMDRDARTVIKTPHHHTGYEVHLVTDGWQHYRTEERLFRIEAGQFLLFPPLLKHQILESAPHTQRFSLSFSPDKSSPLPLSLPDPTRAHTGQLSLQITDSLQQLLRMPPNAAGLDGLLWEQRVFELAVLLLRAAGARDRSVPAEEPEEDVRLTLAKQFIEDNINQPLTVADVAACGNLSEKQITRLFLQYEGLSPQKYIHRQRVAAIERMLADENLSLREISETMHFSSEYYFNAFFKKHQGVPPKAYRLACRKDPEPED